MFTRINFSKPSAVTIGFEPSSYIVSEADMIVQVCAEIRVGDLQRNAVVNLFTVNGSATGLLVTLARPFNPFSNDISSL